MNWLDLVVTCAFGLEAVVRRELEALGFAETRVSDGRVEFRGARKDIPLLNLWLRSADRVLIKLAEFPAIDFDQLYDGTSAVPWEAWLPADAKMTVDGKSVRSILASVRSCQSIVKKAMVERLKERLAVALLPETGAEFTVLVSLLNDTAQLTLDTTGPGLNKRGYRLDSGDAPLRETLAAALVQLSFWERERVLLDPMCGSGTILIEAAMIARNMAPGLARTFASERWPLMEASLWEEARAAARTAMLPSGGLRITGSDMDPRMVEAARANAKRAGVQDDIVFECRNVTDLKLSSPYGVLVTNPPYGIKLGRPEDLSPLYSAFDRALKPMKGWSVYVITADKKFPDAFTRAKPDRIRKLFNGTIEANYYQYYGERPPRD